MRRWFAWLAVAATMSIGCSGARADLESIVRATPPEQQAVAREVIETLQTGNAPVTVLPKLDKLLGELTTPNPLRGVVQTTRATLLGGLNRGPEAIQAADEGARLLPEEGVALFTASAVHLAFGDTARSADLWLRATRIDPQMARQTDEAMIKEMIRTLRLRGETARADAIAIRRDEIGLTGRFAADRSASALSALRAAAAVKDWATARARIPAVIDPDHFVQLLIDRRYEKIWPDIEGWTGPALSKQRPAYLAELEREWVASRDLDAAAAFIAALGGVGDDARLIAEFEPVVAAQDADSKSSDGVKPMLGVARALIQTRQDAQAARLLDRFQTLWPSDTPEGMMIAINRMDMQLADGQPAAVLARIDDLRAKIRAIGLTGNDAALIEARRLKICARGSAGATVDDALDLGAIAGASKGMPGTYLLTLFCLDRYDDARRFIIARLESADPDDAVAALSILQRRSVRRKAGTYTDRLLAYTERLRADPMVLAAVRKKGRILDFPIDRMPAS